MTIKAQRIYDSFGRMFKRSVGFFSPKSYQPSPLKNELLGLFCFAACIFVLLSLWSFSESDLNPLPEHDFRNWLGRSGAWLSLFLLQSLGIFALVIPISLGYISWYLFFKNELSISWQKTIGLFFINTGLMAEIAALHKSLIKNSFLISGKLGLAIKYLLLFCFSHLGLWLITITFILGGILLLLGRPFIAQLSMKMFTSRPKKTSLPEPVKNLPCPSLTILPPVLEKSLVPPKLAILPVESFNTAPAVSHSQEINLLSDIPIVEKERVKDLSLVKKNHRPPQKESLFTLPPLNLLDYDAPTQKTVDPQMLKKEADKLQRAFLQFGIEGKIREIRPGPVVTNYEFVPAPGIKLSRIAALSDDIAMAMSAVHVRIVTPIPGKGAVGIEVPNDVRETVYLKEIVADARYNKEPHPLCMAVGKDVEGDPYFMNLADMPHVLIAGTTGSGKSVSVNAMICSILYRATPKEVRFLMIDPKMLELSIYNGIPHLLLPPIIDAKKAANALRWAVKEMDQRYAMMKEASVRDIQSYNDRIKDLTNHTFKEVEGRKHEHLPYVVIVVDEYADLLAVAGKEVEGYVMRLAQKARAAGIHVMLATQRPSVDVITGVIKANFPVRMGFRLASSHDSKTIINKTGAEKLLGKGDVLIIPPGTSDVFRIHGAFISEKELSRVVEFLKNQKEPDYQEDIVQFSEEETQTAHGSNEAEDEKFAEALEIVRQYNKCSTSFLQRHLSVGYNRAARIVELMEKKGLVGPVLNARGDRELFMND